MESVDAKIERADVHLNVLHNEVRDYLETHRPTFLRKSNIEGTQTWLVCFFEDTLPRLGISTIMGDCIYNLRSALDSLVCGMVRTTDPISDCATPRRQFPITDKAGAFDNMKHEWLAGVPLDAVKLIRKFQPFERPEKSRRFDPLFILNELSNRDKHRALNLTYGYTRDVKLLIPLRSGDLLSVQIHNPIYPSEPEQIMLDGVRPDQIDDCPKVRVQGSSVLAIREDGPWRDRQVSDVIQMCADHVKNRVIPAFAPFFG